MPTGMRPALLALAALLLTGLMTRPPEPDGAKDPAPLVTLTGTHSKITEPQYARLTSAKDFQALYLRHLGEDPAGFDEFYNPHGVPVIDFEQCMVVAVFQGDGWNSAGVYVREILEQDGSLVIRFADRSYQTAGPDGGGRRVTPWAFFVLPRTSREVILQDDVRTLIADPPKWEEKARFAAL